MLSDVVKLPSYEDCRAYRDKHIVAPTEKIVSDGITIGVFNDTRQLIHKYLPRLFEANSIQPARYHVKFKVGADGSVHKAFRMRTGPVSEKATINVTLIDCMALEVWEINQHQERLSVWREPTPGASKKTKMLGIISLPENSDVVTEHILDMQLKQNEMEKETIQLESGHEVTVEFKEREDKKMVHHLTGLGDGCDTCTVRWGIVQTLLSIDLEMKIPTT